MAVSDEVKYYSKTDDKTQKLIDMQLKRQYRRQREKFWLNVTGLGLGFVITLAFLSACVYLVMNDKVVSGTILGTVDIVALASVFVYANNVRKAPGS